MCWVGDVETGRAGVDRVNRWGRRGWSIGPGQGEIKRKRKERERTSEGERKSAKCDLEVTGA